MTEDETSRRRARVECLTAKLTGSIDTGKRRDGLFRDGCR